MSDASGAMTFTEVARGSINKSQFDSNDVFIFDSGILRGGRTWW